MTELITKNQSSLELQLQKWWRYTKMGRYFAFFAIALSICLMRMTAQKYSSVSTPLEELIVPIQASWRASMIGGAMCISIMLYSRLVSKGLPRIYRDTTVIHILIASTLGGGVGLMIIKYWSTIHIINLSSQ